ncbi:hypothetical protein Nepgr_003281 [Nepenthes gracilis]|uniref:Cytochrome P450 n=1 Tax=Nepenthes gracilis TaxID=150966 RepID=A0AAD3RZC0_NEPGR|nr:hypothetical protein Nepgr_003281 [Nepenthes gracilis]
MAMAVPTSLSTIPLPPLQILDTSVTKITKPKEAPTKPTSFSNHRPSPPLERAPPTNFAQPFTQVRTHLLPPIWILSCRRHRIPLLIQEFFSGKTDVILANRPFQIFSKHIGNNFTTVGNVPYGEHWRRLRKIITSEIFSPLQISRFTDVRKREVKELIGKLYQKSRQSSSADMAKVELRPLFDPEFYLDVTIKGFIVNTLIAGHNTTSNTIEWVMSLLLNYPEELSKARKEISTHVRDDRLIEESDLSKLQYLNNMIFETLRLYPAAPLLVPHMSSQDCEIAGFKIPQGTMLLGNAWAIHRDPNLWEDPTNFKPERFQGADVNACYNYRYIPFGVGRRACPGEALASRVIRLVVASLIQCFE